MKNNQKINWKNVRRVLVVRLRSIGDTVLATPSLIALRRFLPDAQIDVLLEDWVAPLLKNFDAVDNVISFKKNDLKSRLQTARKIRANNYDVAFNLHGGTTATFFVRASGAKYRVGFQEYQYDFLYTHRAPSPLEFWQTGYTHSAEQQLALLGFVSIPVADRPKSRLAVTESARSSIEKNFRHSSFIVHLSPCCIRSPHLTRNNGQRKISRESPNFCTIKTFQSVAVATKKEREVLENLRQLSSVPIEIFDDLTLPEITALASRAEIFVGNDSGIAHIAAAVETPTVVIFGSSNRHHWRPWTNAPNENCL